MTADRVVHKSGLATTDLLKRADDPLAHAGPAVALRFVDAAERAVEQLRTGPCVRVLYTARDTPGVVRAASHRNGITAACGPSPHGQPSE